MYRFFAILIFSILMFSKNLESKVYDCFPFFNELEILEVRLNELNDAVDYFVLVENPLTQSGLEKPLYFEENKQRFKKFADKIIHIVGPRRDASNLEPWMANWFRENSQRNDILLGLKDAKDEDIIIISDLDEIVKKEKVQEIQKAIAEKKDPIRLEMILYRYFLNRKDKASWSLGYATSYKTLQQHSPEILRCKFKHTHLLADAGWHFSDMGGIKRFIYKINACAHQDRNTKHWKTPYKILKKSKKCRLVRIDNSYPEYIVKNIKYFKDRNYIDDHLPPNWHLRLLNKRQKKMDESLIKKGELK